MLNEVESDSNNLIRGTRNPTSNVIQVLLLTGEQEIQLAIFIRYYSCQGEQKSNQQCYSGITYFCLGQHKQTTSNIIQVLLKNVLQSGSLGRRSVMLFRYYVLQSGSLGRRSVMLFRYYVLQSGSLGHRSVYMF